MLIVAGDKSKFGEENKVIDWTEFIAAGLRRRVDSYSLTSNVISTALGFN